ncbi:MAG: hypothetical protein WC135_07380 [Bacteroidales bacterium]
MLEWIILAITVLNLTLTTTDVISDKKEKKKAQQEQIIKDFKSALITDENPNPVDSIVVKKDTIMYYKQGEFIGSSVTTTKKKRE